MLGPESTASWEGAVYTGVEGGAILRLTDGDAEQVAQLGRCGELPAVTKGRGGENQGSFKGSMYVVSRAAVLVELGVFTTAAALMFHSPPTADISLVLRLDS